MKKRARLQKKWKEIERNEIEGNETTFATARTFIGRFSDFYLFNACTGRFLISNAVVEKV